MYAYDELDRTLINERVSEFRDQVKRRLSGELTEDEFKMLRLQNGVYLQLHAYMFRVAIPYGTLSAKQLRAPISPRSASTPCRLQATTRATSRRTNGRAWRPARSKIPASGPSCYGST